VRLPAGVHAGVSDAGHHADPALGSTDLKHLLRSPARFRHERDHPTPASAAMDLGSVAHALILGVGAPWVLSPYSEYRTTESKQWRRRQQQAGVTPIKRADLDIAEAMADAVFDHEVAGPLVGRATHVEATAVADVITGDGAVRCKARYDALIPEAGIDVKTTSDPDLEPRALAAAMRTYRYHLQGGAYGDVMDALGEPARDHLLVWVSSTPPHFVAVRRFTARALDRGRELAATAREIHRRCEAAGVWPGPAAFADLDLPGWDYATTDHLDALDALDPLEDLP